VLLPSLHPCFPNPFNPRTTIAFDLPRRQAVSLRIYDVGGRLVRTLLAGEVLDPGRHEVTWMGRDDNGRPMGSGTYFSRLEAEGFHATRRMVLLK
jgi:flagellar hook assembly protein FlgD